MADIDLTNLTNSTDTDEGNGVFDLLIQAVERHIEGQFDEGRITGTDFATVYLGSMQTVLQQSIQFLLTEQEADKKADLIAEQIVSEQKKNEAGGLIDLEKQKVQEGIDLIIAQTANQYEQISASRQNTVRENLLNSKAVIKLDKDTELVISQNSELLLNGPVDRDLKTEQKIAVTSGALDKTNETNAKVALINAQELEVEASTVRNDAESAKKVLLLDAQTIGFRADSKQKLLKTMMDGVAVDTTTNGIPLTTDMTQATAIEAVANDILDDWVSSVNI